MPKQAPNVVLDAAFNRVAAATELHVISAYAMDDARATVVGNSLGSVAVDSGDFTVGEAAGGGRQVQVAAQSGVPVTGTNQATHVALVDATDVLYVTTCTPQDLTAGNTVNFPSWTASIADPT